MNVRLTCVHCGIAFERDRGHVDPDSTRPVFCSRRCAGAQRHRRTDVTAVRTAAVLGPGWTKTREIAGRLGMSVNTTEKVLERLRKRGEVEAVGGPYTHRYWRRAPRRRCAHDGCETILSAYNPLPYCALHAPQDIDHREYIRLCEVAS